MRRKAGPVTEETNYLVLIDRASIVLFTPESSKRLAAVRMRLGMTQSEFAEKLGTTQQVITSIERGKRDHCKEITIEVLKRELKDHWKHVVFNKGNRSYDYSRIRLDYWKHKFKKMGESNVGSGRGRKPDSWK